jgi:predicted O-methyltransferase YrrM
LISLEHNPRHAAIARENIARAGLAPVIDVRVGMALDSLASIQTQGLAPFDLIFIDADKPNNPAYLAWALKLSRPGSAIIDAGTHAGVQGTRRMLESIANTAALSATAVQTVDSKGHDGFAIAIVGAHAPR